MDDPGCDPEVLREALDALSRAGRWLGGDRLLRKEVARQLRGIPPGPVRLLDVGTGSGASAQRLSRWLSRRGWQPSLVLSDRHAETLRIARRRLPRGGSHGEPEAGEPDAEGRLVRLTAGRLPFAEDAFDLVISSATLHHLERSGATAFLAELARVSKRGWVVVDLRRSLLTYAAVRLLAGTVWRRNPLNRWDGPVSVRRSFTGAEARALAREAGREEATVTVRPFRLAIRGAEGGGAR